MISPTRRRSSRGAAAVEFALVVPLLLLLVMGIIDFGWMLMKSNLLNNAARDAARIASLGGSYAEVDTTLDAELTSAGIDLGDVTEVISCSNTSGASCNGSAASYTTNVASGTTVMVTVSYTHQWLTPIGSLCELAGGSSCVGDTILLERAVTMVRE